MTNLATFVDDTYTTDETLLKFRLRDLILLKLAHQNACTFTYNGKMYSVGCISDNIKSWNLYVDDCVKCYNVLFDDVLNTLIGYVSGKVNW